MDQANSPPDAAEQLDLEAASHHEPVVAGSKEPAGKPAAESDPDSASVNGDARVGASGTARKCAKEMTGGGWSGQHPHVFHLASWSPDTFAGGTLQGATGDNWKILAGQQASVYLAKLGPGGVREPHWHPSAWELNFVISGSARWSLVGPEATHDAFEVVKGDLVFAPQGHFHYFENASETEDLVVLIVFNSSSSEPADDVGIVASLSAIPADVLGAVFNVPRGTFDKLPRKLERVTIAKKP
jgi:oxalate decarboxylase